MLQEKYTTFKYIKTLTASTLHMVIRNGDT